jgi:hypothetical protein
MKHYTARVRAVRQQASEVDLELEDGVRTFFASGTVLKSALINMGRKVEFTAELSERTTLLSQPLYCIGSAVGFRVVK